VEQRTHHQITGEPMKFLSLAYWTGIIETELFAQTYKSYGLASITQGNGDSSLLPLAFVQLAQADKLPPNQE